MFAGSRPLMSELVVHGRGWGGELRYRGSYRFNGDSIVGSLNFDRAEPSREQLKEFLTHP